MTDFLQQLIIGLRLGSVYALVALGYTMVYGIIRLINFAHGDFIMVGAIRYISPCRSCCTAWGCRRGRGCLRRS